MFWYPDQPELFSARDTELCTSLYRALTPEPCRFSKTLKLFSII